DANGIVHVSAKDLGTGAEQAITITASTNLSEADIDKAVKEAEQFAAEDKKKKEAIDVKNQADTMVYQSEKTLTDAGDKLSAEEKAGVQAEIDKLKELLKGNDTEAIKAGTEALTKKMYEVASKLYPQGGADMGAAPGADAGAQTDDGAYEADYTVVDEDK
ncbi:MAG: Hsp70 family protein, partial [Clostridia bacterium]|nr:Hsp70 family protein [Clostridia bacterium]